jgi:hypothetical protein
MGFPLKFEQERFDKIRNRKSILSKRKRHIHTSRGKTTNLMKFERELLEHIKYGVRSDWRYDGEDEYEVEEFDCKQAAHYIMQLLKKKKVIKHLL